MAVKIRFAEPADAAAIRAVYAPFCKSTAVSFELHPPTVDEMIARMAKISSQYPWLVCETDGKVAGYVYACQHRERAAYRWAVDVTVYIDAAYRRRGMGKALYTALIALLRQQGFARAFAGITLPNPGSVGLHEAVGFRQIAVYQKVGFKLGQWRDVGWWDLDLRLDAVSPAEPRPISELRGESATAAVFAAAEQMIRAQPAAAEVSPSAQ